MSLIFDKGKFKYFQDMEQLKKSYNNNNNLNINKNIPKKNLSKNNHLYKDYESTSPIRNINNSKKPNFFTTYENNLNNNIKIQQNYNKKTLNSKKLKYNKSFEVNMINDELMNSNNFDFINEDMHTIQQEKNNFNKKFNNNSVILNNNKPYKTKNKNKHNNKSVTKTINSHINNNNKNFGENLIIKKLDEKFKSLESNIIDKKYENDIDHDEIIISTNKKNLVNSNSNRAKTANTNNKSNHKLSNIINDKNNDNYIEDKNDDIFKNLFEKRNSIDFDENYLLNTSFENNRNDFNIMYTDDYEKTVINDMLSLEIKLLIEKMIELQKSYHKELNIIISQYNKNEEIFKILIEKVKMLQKKIYLIKKINEIKNIKGNIYNFIGIYNNNSKQETNKININEFFLWRCILNIPDKRSDFNIKEKLKDLFRRIIFDKYNKISYKMNNIENKIIINLMKKFKYNMNNINRNNNGFMSNGSHKGISSNKNINQIYSSSPVQNYKYMIKQNKNINSTSINNKKRHKKTSSCYQTKPSKFTYFKNNKQK